MKKALWYTSLLVIVPFGIVFMFVQNAAIHLVAALSVVENVLFRWQLWAFNYPKGQLMNCPWRYTLRQVYVNTLHNIP
jgi:hypothetical protein